MDENAQSGSPKTFDGAPTRRLAALVVADVVGYTRLMERDDTGTFAQLGSIRNELIDPVIVSHGGRIVQTAGDGWLAEFPSALAALRASIQIQCAMGRRNADIESSARIDYRMGVNLGDIMVQGSEIAGDGVNVASRLESLAEPGAICVSSAVRERSSSTIAIRAHGGREKSRLPINGNGRGRSRRTTGLAHSTQRFWSRAALYILSGRSAEALEEIAKRNAMVGLPDFSQFTVRVVTGRSRLAYYAYASRLTHMPHPPRQ